MSIKMDKSNIFVQNAGQMTTEASHAVLERQLLLQLGDRLKLLRKSQGLSAVALASRVGISRTTLSAVEAGDPAPSMGTYLRVMSALGIGGELALLAGDTLLPPVAGTAAARSQRPPTVVHIRVTADPQRHRAQDLQSLALHEAAVRTLRDHPEWCERAQHTLDRWIEQDPASRSLGLWREWKIVLANRSWRKVLGSTRRAQELRQASPIVGLLPPEVREQVLDEVRRLKRGVNVGGDAERPSP